METLIGKYFFITDDKNLTASGFLLQLMPNYLNRINACPSVHIVLITPLAKVSLSVVRKRCKHLQGFLGGKGHEICSVISLSLTEVFRQT